MKGIGERIEKEITIIRDREASDLYQNGCWWFDFKDNEGNEYEWNTATDPDNIMSNQKWLVRMTLKSEHEVMGFKYCRVDRVKFIKQL